MEARLFYKYTWGISWREENQDRKWLEETWGPNMSRQGWSREKHLDMLFWH